LFKKVQKAVEAKRMPEIRIAISCGNFHDNPVPWPRPVALMVNSASHWWLDDQKSVLIYWLLEILVLALFVWQQGE
jgi:hypothetical protein